MKTWLKVTLIVAVLGIAGLSYIYFFMYNKPHENYDSAKAEFSLQAKDLYEAYKSDTATANKKYNGKVLEVIGTLDSIENHYDTILVAVFTFEQGMFGPQGVRCSFNQKHFAEAKKLKNNTAVRLKGVCQGFNDTDVILESTSIVE